jgi:hypothetical protein
MKVSSLSAYKETMPFSAKDGIQPKLSMSPPPAMAEVFRKDRLLSEVCGSVMVLFD